ncbi:MAG: glycolate oxidase subunit GlcF [Rhodospirillales bacterium]|nr:glycolate oxidase subunit GlcF [Rhodospirillales bacterium]
MQTDFTPAQLADPQMAASAAVIRKCVHCGFCTATCPTYVLLGDELDSPRGRIYLMKDMLENERIPGPDVVKHIDRCLSCLSCMTTCPSGVNYMHLVDHARAYIERHYRRPWAERAMRALVAAILPYPARFRAALALARRARPLAPFLARVKPLRPAAAMLHLAPAHLPPKAALNAGTAPGPRGRVVLMQGCAEPVLRPEIRAATIRLLERCGYQVSFAAGETCCGALTHHMGKEHAALHFARRNVDAWTREIETGLDAILITASGCGTTIKDYGFMLREDPVYAAKAAKVSALAKDVCELLEASGLPARADIPALNVVYHPPCSLQHGQKITTAPQNLLRAAGFAVRLPADAHLCCGSAGTYNIFQPEIAAQLGARKAESIAALRPDVVATGNIGCAVQISQAMQAPVLHVVELLDWATGGPAPGAG